MMPFVKDYTAALRKPLASPGDLGSLVYSSPVTGERLTSSAQLGHENWVEHGSASALSRLFPEHVPGAYPRQSGGEVCYGYGRRDWSSWYPG